MNNNVLYDIFVSFFGAFFGFLFALLSEAVVSSYAKKKDMHIYLSNIREELTEIQQALIDNKYDMEASLMIDYPLLEAFIASGEIRHILKKSYYNNLIYINTKLKKANDVEKKHENPDWIITTRKELLTILDDLLSNNDFISDAPRKTKTN